MTDEYKIGYGKPPRHTRFQKGRSGNPKGRPKKKNASFFDIADHVANKRIKIHEHGRSRKVNLIEAFMNRIIFDAVKGDARSQRLVAGIFTKLEMLRKKMPEYIEMPRITLMGDIMTEDGKKLTFDIGEEPNNKW